MSRVRPSGELFNRHSLTRSILFWTKRKERFNLFFASKAFLKIGNYFDYFDISIVLNINNYNINNNWNSNEEAPKVVTNSRLTESNTSVSNAVQAVNLTEFKKEVLER